MIIVGILITLFMVMTFYHDFSTGIKHGMTNKHIARMIIDGIMIILFAWFAKGV